MKKLWLLALIIILAVPCYAFAQDEVIEEVIEADVAPSISKDLAYEKTEQGYGKKRTEQTAQACQSSSTFLSDRKGRFRVGLVGPGYAVANKGAGSMMAMGVEGEYFFWDKLSAGMRIEVATDFDDITLLSFVPRARYVFDLTNHPRWSIYVQGGVGLALYNAKHAAADIAIPGGGFWWQWTDNWSVGADASMHILVRSTTAVGFTIGPAIRYQF
ncbi:MAG: hypothetical protein ABH871_02785 [Pseudomonadota bacterium]